MTAPQGTEAGAGVPAGAGGEAGARHASLMLVLVTVVWGLSFPWTKSWQVASGVAGAAPGVGPAGPLLSSLTLIALRMPLAVLLLGLWQPGLFRRPSREEHRAGALIGAVFFAGFLLQTVGLAYTSPALSAFFTCISGAWVPVLAWLVLGVRSQMLTLLGLGVGLVGCAVLVEGGWAIGTGDWLTLGASVLMAVQMLLLDRLGRRLDPGHFSASFLAITGVLGAAGAVGVAALTVGLGPWAAWVADMLSRPAILGALAALAALPTVLGFHWMNVYQPRVPATRAALIYLLEPVFSSVFSVWLGYDQVTSPLLVGGGLILAGNVLVELPGWLRRRSRPRPGPGGPLVPGGDRS